LLYKERGDGIFGVKFKPFMKSYAFIAALGISFSVIESFFFEDYCDINSFHYQSNFDRRKILTDLKSKFNLF
jgi:hypothetical protein